MNNLESVLKSMNLEFFAAGKHKISTEKLFRIPDAVFLDVRSSQEVESVSFPLKFQAEAIHIPTDEIPERISEIPRDKTVGIFCSAGTRSAIVYAFLRANGFDNVRIIVGGYDDIMNNLKPGKVWSFVK